ncbi:MAG: hypothetical protein H6836_09265 [Planctomycetes bacterium]|nr:hypothetical protein [Planctomycetota bacterium]
MTDLLRSRRVSAGFVERQNLLLDRDTPRSGQILQFSSPATTSRDLATLLTNGPG